MTKNTGRVIIHQKSFAATCAITKKLENYSSLNLLAYVSRNIVRSANRTIESYIINADPATDDTNINCFGQVPTNDKVHRLGGSAGIRHHGLKGCVDNKGNIIENTTNKFTIGAYTDGDFLKAKAMLGCNGANKKDLLFIMSNMSECSSLALPCIKCRDTAGLDASFFTGEINQAYGIPMYVSTEMPDLTDANGMINADTTMNQYGTFALIKRSAVQYGFGQTVEVDTVKFPAQGVCVVACFDFGFTICDCTAQKDEHDRSIVVGCGGEVIGFNKAATTTNNTTGDGTKKEDGGVDGGSTVSIEDARAAYKAENGKDVPSNKKNDLEWIVANTK